MLHNRIGTELLNGQIQDTNSYWMAQQIAALGGYVRRIAILDDDVDEISRVLSDACKRKTRIVITSGGLGPTPDDLNDGQLTLVLPFLLPGVLFRVGGRTPRLTGRSSHMIGKSSTGQDVVKWILNKPSLPT